jgi:hypothetical protein
MTIRENALGLSLFGISLAIGIAIGGYFVGQMMYNARVAINTAEAKGLAERRVSANLANWDIQYQVSGRSKKDLQKLYTESEQDQKIIVALLKENGFDDAEIEIGVINYSFQEFRDENQKLVDEKHQLTGVISIETNKVEKVAQARTKLNKLIAQGIDIINQAPAYRFTRLNDIKPDMVKEATKNARIAANEFAVNAGVKVGGIRSAEQGAFFIRDAGEDFGDTGKIEKDVRVVTNITFYLTE